MTPATKDVELIAELSKGIDGTTAHAEIAERLGIIKSAGKGKNYQAAFKELASVLREKSGMSEPAMALLMEKVWPEKFPRRPEDRAAACNKATTADEINVIIRQAVETQNDITIELVLKTLKERVGLTMATLNKTADRSRKELTEENPSPADPAMSRSMLKRQERRLPVGTSYAACDWRSRPAAVACFA